MLQPHSPKKFLLVVLRGAPAWASAWTYTSLSASDLGSNGITTLYRGTEVPLQEVDFVQIDKLTHSLAT